LAKTRKTYFLDANIFLRFLTGDEKRKAAACRRLVQMAIDGKLTLRTHPLILAEVVWVLESYYELPRSEIASKLELILNTPNLSVVDESAFSQAVGLYAASNIDLADCYAAALANEADDTLLSYDRDFDKLDGIEREKPEDVI